jgi:biopolymer transport protein ExbD
MVDVAFLLLIFFMTTTTFKPPEEITIDLPTSNAEYKVPETNVLILSITRGNELYVQDDPRSPAQKLMKDQVGAWVRTERSRNPRVRMIVKADRNCEYGIMEDVMDILQAERTNRFVLMTEGEGAEKEGGGKALPEGAAAPAGVGADGQLAQAPGTAAGAAEKRGETWAR